MNFAHNTPAPLFRFGISFNKMFDYLAAEKPILSDFPCPYNPAVQWGAGVSVDSADPIDIAAEIEKFIAMEPDNYKTYSEKAALAAKKYDFKELTKKLISIIKETP